MLAPILPTPCRARWMRDHAAPCCPGPAARPSRTAACRPLCSWPRSRFIGQTRFIGQKRWDGPVACVLALAVLLVLWCSGPVYGQPVQLQFQAQPRIGEEQSGYVELPMPPREVRQALSRSEEAIQAGEFTEAVEALATIVSNPAMEDYFIAQAGDETTLISVKATAQRMLGHLPDQGRDLYELQYGRDARRLLDESLRQGNIAGVTEVSRRFFHTEAGYEATLLLGRYELDRGQPLAASFHLKRLAAVPKGVARFDPELPLLLATCWHRLGEAEQAQATLVALRDRSPGARIRLGNRQVTLFEQDDQALTWLEQLAGPALPWGPSMVDQWAMFRGSPTRNATISAGPPLPSMRWRQRVSVPHDDEPQDEEIVREQYKAFMNQGLAVLPALQPLAVGDYVLMRTPRHLFGVHLETGKLIWPWPWIDEEEVAEVPDPTMAARRGQVMSAREERLQQTVWADATYGQISSDGERVFLLYQPPHLVVPASLTRNPFGFRGAANGDFALARNQLAAAELKTEGKTSWVVGGDDGDEPQLEHAFFLGAPLPLGDQLYVLAELRDEIKLVVLDAATGKLQWSQQLAHVEPTNSITWDETRRLAGATPSYADGVLVCPTSAGAVVAVDVASRSLLWAHTYSTPDLDVRRQRGFVITNTVQVDELPERWQDATATIVDGRVLITPIETDELYCLDLFTGKPLWEKPGSRETGLFIAGVHQGNIVIIGKDRATAMSLQDGHSVYEVELPNQLMPSGRGYFAGDDYYLPATEKHLIRFNVVDGRIEDVRPTQHQLGNLICYRDQVISLGHDWLYAFYQQDKLRDIVARRLQKNPDDAEMLEHQARLHLEDGQPLEALASLRRALSSYPPDSAHRLAARHLLVDVLLACIESDFSQHDTWAAELHDVMQTSQQRHAYLRIAAQGHERAGEPIKAFEAYLELARIQTEVERSPDDALLERGLVQVDAARQVMPEIWVGARLRQLLAGATAEQRRAMESRVADMFAGMDRQLDREPLQRMARLFPNQAQSHTTWMELARDDIQSGRAIRGEHVLLALTDSPSQAAEATAQLARLYQSHDRAAALARQLEKLETQWADAVVEPDTTGRQLAEQLRTLPLSTTERLGDWPYGQVQVTTEPMQRPVQSINQYSVQLLETTGEWPNGWRVVYDLVNQRIAILDSFGQRRLVAAAPRSARNANPVQQGVYHAKALGHILVVSLADQIVALDTLSQPTRDTDAVLWQIELSEGVTASSRVGFRTNTRSLQNPWTWPRNVAQSPAGDLMGWLGPVTSQGVCIQKQRLLQCVDPLTGETRWSRRDVPPGCELLGDEDHLFVIADQDETARVFSMIDGSELESKPVPPQQRRIARLAGCILTWDGDYQRQAPVQLKLLDIWTGDSLWSLQVQPGTKLDVVGTDQLAVLEPSGKFRIVQWDEGTVVLEAQVEPEPQLQHIVTLRSRDQYLLLTNHTYRPPAEPGEVTLQVFADARPTFGNTPLLTGSVYAFDRATGQPMWSTPASFERFGFAVDQPVDLPLLYFSRLTNEVNRQGRRTSQTQHGTQLMCLDRRTGQPVLEEMIPKKYAYLSDLYAVPADNTVTLELLGDRQFTLTFTDRPRPPAPPPVHERTDAPAERPIPGPIGAAIQALEIFGRTIERLETE